MTQLNGIDVDDLREYVASAASDQTVADRDPVVVAYWEGSDRAKVTFPSGQAPVLVGGDGPSAMKLLLAALAACDVEVIATRAAFLGLEIDSLTVEAGGHFNIRRFLDLDAGPDPGYEQITYAVRLKTNGGTPAQLAELRRACEEASPVGDTLRRHVPLNLRFDAR